MNIGLFAKKHGLSIDSLRFYEDMQLLTPDRKPNGYRQYTSINEQQIKIILSLKAVGFNLQEIKTLLELSKKPPSTACNVLSNQLFDQKIYEITQQIVKLQHAKIILAEVKASIENNSFVKNQTKIQQLIEKLYQLFRHPHAND